MPVTYESEILPDSHWWMQGRARALARLLRRRVGDGGPSLDVGAGNGFWAEWLSPRFEPVWLLEPDSKLSSQIEARRLGSRLLKTGLPGPLPFEDNMFRLITALDVIEHIEDDKATANELFRLTAAGGYLLTTVPAHPHLWSVHDENVGHKRRYTKDSFDSLVRGAGFSIEVMSAFNVWLYPAAWAARKLGRVGDELPPGPINKTMTRIFASEGRFLGRWPSWARGLSWVCLARKEPLS